MAVVFGMASPAFAQQPSAPPASDGSSPALPAQGSSPILSEPPAHAGPAAPESSSASDTSAVDGSETAIDAEGEDAFVAPGISRAALPHDLSPWGMFMAADLVVKAVMTSLAFASVLTWTVWLAKSIELLGAKRRLRHALRVLNAAHSLHDAENALARVSGPAADLVRAARAEWSASQELPGSGVKDRVSMALARIEARAGRSMAIGTGLLATMGSTAPFVGLFGTVWGIMNSFIGISRAQTTNLAVVAPGIAEALLATAIGLVVAIPAVVIYNVFARAIAGYRANLGDASAIVMRLLSRDLDRQAVASARESWQMPRASFGQSIPAE
ncbi:tonB-system energizer ExbB [Rhodoligotrophos ferricapiens]|uniref:tonB-system energizer ExbB n=1 Tax=Rhodoligotrophos ferricapiens TaxID=3069264 RepID=UPI00315C71C7